MSRREREQHGAETTIAAAVDDRLRAHLELAELSDEEFVRRAYRFALRRDPEPAALERRVSRATLLRELVASEEFARLAALDEAIAATGEGRFLEAPPGTDERLIEIPWALAALVESLAVRMSPSVSVTSGVTSQRVSANSP